MKMLTIGEIAVNPAAVVSMQELPPASFDQKPSVVFTMAAGPAVTMENATLAEALAALEAAVQADGGPKVPAE